MPKTDGGLLLFFWLSSFICSPSCSSAGGRGENWFKTHSTTAVMLARCQPGSNNTPTRTHVHKPPQLDDPGVKEQTGHQRRFGIYTGCSSLCTLVCVCVCAHRQKAVGLGQCHVWTALSLTQRSEQEPHVEFICYRNKRREWKLSNV